MYGGLDAITVEPAPASAASRSASTSSTVEPERGRVGRRDRERVGRDVGRGDGARPARAALIARAIAPEPVPTSSTRRRRPLGQEREAALDQHLGLRPGHEHAPVDRQVEAVEPPPAQDVGDRLAPPAPLEQRPAGGQLRLVAAAGRSSCRARSAAGRARARSGARRRAAASGCRARRGTRSRAAAPRPSVPHPPAAAASLRRRSSAASASENSLRSPPSTRFRSCTVSPMRWSVTRSCG